MAKQGQHKHDRQDPRVSKGPNNPDKSVTITTGSYKKRETTRQQHARHEDADRPGQFDKNEWVDDTSVISPPSARDREGRSDRSGSDSNADTGSRGH